jgi:hypothetical protein
MTTSTPNALQVRSLDEPDTCLEPPLARVDSVTIDDRTIVRVVAQPGWRWSTSVGPSAGTASCELPHVGYLVSGRLHVRHDDGTEGELTAGDAFTLTAGHDAWVVGDEEVVLLEV